MSHTFVAKVTEFPDGESRVVEHDGADVAIFHADGKFYAVQNECPHAWAPLVHGAVEDCVVTCPLHGWSFNITDGAPVSAPPNAPLKCFQVNVVNGEVRLPCSGDAPQPNSD